MATVGSRRRVLWLRCLLLACCVLIPAGVSADYRTVEVEGLRITIDSVWAPRSAPGYLPVRFDIANLGEARVIEIVGQGSRFFRTARGGGAASSSVRQAVRLARGDRVRLTVPVPIFADNENIQFQIREDNRTLERFSVSVQSRVAARDASTLIVANSARALGSNVARWLRPFPGRTTTVVTPRGTTALAVPPPAGGPSLDLLLDPARLPTNWLGYTSLRAVFIGPEEWDQLSDAQKSALLTWIASGGDLMFVDGDLRVLGLPEHPMAEADANAAVRRHFLGRIHLVTSASIDAAGISLALAAVDGLQDRNWALPANGAPDWGVIGTRGFLLPVPGIEGVPARAYLFILLLFSLLIGPVNYWLLRRQRRQVLVVLTAPVISLLFIVLLAGYAVAVEGFAVYGRAVTFTMLDQVSRYASTRASVSLYAAGMTPSDGLRFPRDVAVFPLGTDGAGTRERLALDLTDAQRFTAGALPARSPTNLELISHRPARERLSFSHEPGRISVVNGLDARVEALLYRHEDRTYSLAQPLAAGGREVLTIGARSVVPSDLPVSSKFLLLLDKQPPGSYLAVLDRSPFWEPGVSGIVERGSFHLVLGLTEGVR